MQMKISKMRFELGPCAHCGCEGVLYEGDYGGRFKVQCEKCYIQTYSSKTPAEAVEDWNCRPGVTPSPVVEDDEGWTVLSLNIGKTGFPPVVISIKDRRLKVQSPFHKTIEVGGPLKKPKQNAIFYRNFVLEDYPG